MSAIDIIIRDSTFAGNILNEITLSLQSESLLVKDIIRARVFQEVEKYNTALPEYYRGLIQPLDSEITLNGFKLKSKKKIDQEQQFYVACDAFQKNAFFVLINDKQALSLDEEIFITKDSEISFIKLTPLAGG